MNWQSLKAQSVDEIVEWAEAQPWAKAMADCQQDSEWHAEGDVWTHTKMVCRELILLDEWTSLSKDQQLVLLFTALFHDSAKPLTSQTDPENGRGCIALSNEEIEELWSIVPNGTPIEIRP